MALFGSVSSSLALSRSYFIRAAQVRKGSTAPSDVTIGTTPTIGALRFSAIAETGSVFATMPINWDRTQNCTLTFYCALTTTETNEDSINLTVDYVVPILLTDGSGIAKTSTQLTASRSVTTGEGLTTGSIYPVVFTLASGDATNPFTSSNSLGFGIEVHLTNLTTVAAIDLVGIRLSYVGLN